MVVMMAMVVLTLKSNIARFYTAKKDNMKKITRCKRGSPEHRKKMQKIALMTYANAKALGGDGSMPVSLHVTGDADHIARLRVQRDALTELIERYEGELAAKGMV